jgi:hypothetical protein
MFVFATPALFGIAALVMWKYPITEARQRRMSRALERRRARRAVADAA